MSPDGSKQSKNTATSYNNNSEIIHSSFPKFWKYKEESVIPTPYKWLEGKRKADNIGDLWRVHDKLYDLSKFIDKHPGGSDWIEVTRGQDVTEAFESSHILNVDKVESILAKYYIKEAASPRNSPYTFKEDGFYKTLKRRVEPVLKKVGTGPNTKTLVIQDALALSYILLALLGAWTGSLLVQIVAGAILGMCVVAAHNFLHMKDNFRRFYFDLCPMNSHEFRITHGLSHHLYTNTIQDYEVTALQPMLNLYPTRSKNLVQRYGSLIYAHFLYSIIMLQDICKRVHLVGSGKVKVRGENLLIFIQLAVFIFLAPTPTRGFFCWLVIYGAASYWLTVVGFNAAHHHPAIFHDGDEPRENPDFGLCQLDSTLDKADEIHKTDFAILTTFGNHPLHHLFPSVCHSKLPVIKPIFEQVLTEFLEKNRYASQLELFIGTHRQYARTEGWSHKRQMEYKFGEF